MRWVFRIFKWVGLGLSILLLLATIVLSMRSKERGDQWNSIFFQANPKWTSEQFPVQGTLRLWFIGIERGQLWLGSETTAPCREEEWFRKDRQWRRADIFTHQFLPRGFYPGERPWMNGTEREWNLGGIGFLYQQSGTVAETGRPWMERYLLAVPLWMLTLLFALWPALFVTRRILRRRRRSFRIRHGLCLHCGYDLRATPERCPECGRAVETKPAAATPPVTDP